MVLRKVMIKMWDIDDVNNSMNAMITPPIHTQYWLKEDISTEDFKTLAREQFEELLSKWEELQGERK